MKIHEMHRFNVDPEEAVKIQFSLRNRCILRRLRPTKAIRYIAGADVAYLGDMAYAAVVVLDFPELRVIECKTAKLRIQFPYIPGLFAFREGPPLIAAFGQLSCTPDMIFFDGHGVAHPRRFGIASHIGVLLNIPGIGVAKRHLFGRVSAPAGPKGSVAPVWSGGEIIGMALRTREGVNPVYVSAGHLTDLLQAFTLMRRTTLKYRIPEPVRHAHSAACRFRDHMESGHL